MSIKKIILPLVLASSLLIFNNCNKPTLTPQDTQVQPAKTDSVISDGHNSANSLDIAGTYTGTLPCADCEGIKTEITLDADSSYTKRIKYIGRSNRFYEYKGSFVWNSKGNKITLSGIKDSPNQYFVGENSLTQLDMTGKRITGEMADKYILHK
jgi:uncharacterized lipoprotein NlpE involved in copper resistance